MLLSGCALVNSRQINSVKLKFNILSLSPRTKNWLHGTQHPRVLQIFTPALNLVNEDNEVLSLVHPSIGNGPFSMVVEEIHFTDFFNPNTAIHLNENALRIGDVEFKIDQSFLWNPLPNWEAMRKSMNKISPHILQIEQILLEEATKESLIKILSQNEPLLRSSQIKEKTIASKAIHLLSEGLRKQSHKLIREGVSKLAGLGIGLTPAGDDFLMGVMHGLWTIQSSEKAKHNSQIIFKAAKHKTNTLSAAWLHAASLGEAGETWHNLFNAILGLDSEKVHISIFHILSTGHTSGADALAGFIHVLKIRAAWK